MYVYLEIPRGDICSGQYRDTGIDMNGILYEADQTWHNKHSLQSTALSTYARFSGYSGCPADGSRH